MGSFVDPLSMPIAPNMESVETGMDRKEANKEPKVAPITKIGMTSPPMNPAPMVRAVSKSLKTGAYGETFPSSAWMIKSTDRPLY